MTKKNKNAPWPNMQLLTSIKESHYEWCKENGRDISWYKQIKNEEKKNKCSAKGVIKNLLL